MRLADDVLRLPGDLPADTAEVAHAPVAWLARSAHYQAEAARIAKLARTLPAGAGRERLERVAAEYVTLASCFGPPGAQDLDGH